MPDYMKKIITIVVSADIESYIAADSEGGYYVLTLDDTKEIELNDRLEGEFDGEGTLFYPVRNLTQQIDVSICLETWDCSLKSAIDTLLGFVGQKDAVVFAGHKRIELPSPNAASLIHDAVTHAP